MFALCLDLAQGPKREQGTIVSWGGGWTATKRSEWATDVWYHLARVLDGKEHILYVDGEESDRAPGGNASGWKGVFGIGKADWGGPFHGAIDDVKLYSRPLSAEEVGREYRKVTAVEAVGKLASTWGNLKSGI